MAGCKLNGGGYPPTAWVGGAGLDIELAHLVFDASAAYDTGHKTNDNTINNNAGHDRGLDGDIFYRFHKLYVGGGASWSQLSTTNYSKQSWHPNPAWDATGSEKLFHSVGRWFTNCRGATI
jgi:hypothetical protein